MISMSAQERQRQLNLVDMHALPHEALVSFVEDTRAEKYTNEKLFKNVFR